MLKLMSVVFRNDTTLPGSFMGGRKGSQSSLGFGCLKWNPNEKLPWQDSPTE